MNAQAIPDELNIDLSGELQLYDYNITNRNVKSKINLTKNVFSFLVEGTKQLICQNKSAEINNQQFLLIKAGNCLMSENLSASKNYRSMLLFFSDAVLLNFLEKNKLQTLNSKETLPYHVCQYDAYLQNFVTSLIQLNSKDDTFKKNILPIKFEEIMQYLLQKKGVAFLQHFLQAQPSQTRHFVNVVESNTLNNLSIKELAFLCSMSISTFKRIFEKNYEATPIRWFQEKRLEHASFLLSTKQKRPTDIFEEIGFDSLSSFTQAFKHKYGSTPKQFQTEN